MIDYIQQNWSSAYNTKRRNINTHSTQWKHCYFISQNKYCGLCLNLRNRKRGIYALKIEWKESTSTWIFPNKIFYDLFVPFKCFGNGTSVIPVSYRDIFNLQYIISFWVMCYGFTYKIIGKSSTYLLKFPLSFFH